MVWWWKFCKSYISHRAKTHNTRLSAHPTKKACWIGGKLWNRKHGFEKGSDLYALSRSLSHEVCPVRDCAPVVPRQEKISGAATGKVVIWMFALLTHIYSSAVAAEDWKPVIASFQTRWSPVDKPKEMELLLYSCICSWRYWKKAKDPAWHQTNRSI